MRRFNLLNGTAMTFGAIAAFGAASSAGAQTATAQSGTAAQATVPPAADLAPQPGPTDQDVAPAPAMAGATPSDAPAVPGIKSAAGADSDIIVTARKRNEKLIDVPISIQAFSQAEIKASGIDDLQTLKDRAGFTFPPQVSNGASGRFFGSLIFRGLSSGSFEPRDSSGSLFIDGIFVSGGLQSVNTADVERIEVLKGPQNTYFGRSTFGGAVNFITRNPSEDPRAELNIRGTARGSVDGDVSVEGPILPGLRARVTGFIHNKVAQYRATDGGPLGAEKSAGIIGTLYMTPSDNSWVRLRAAYSQDDDSAPSYGFISGNAQGQGCIGRAVPGFNGRTGAGGLTLRREYTCNGTPSLDNIRGFTNFLAGTGPTQVIGADAITSNTVLPPFVLNALTNRTFIQGGVQQTPQFYRHLPYLNHAGLRRNSLRLSGQAGYTFDSGASLAFNVGTNGSNGLTFNDVDKTDGTVFATIVGLTTQDLTADGRFVSDPSKPIRFLLGASYFQGTTRIISSDVNYGPQTVVFGPFGLLADEHVKVPAVYGSIDVDLVEGLTATLEGRYQKETITNYSIAGVPTTGKSKEFLPRAILKYQPTRDTNIYASYAEGVQPARLQSNFPVPTTLTFRAEATALVQQSFPNIGPFTGVPSLKTYEIGWKQRLFGGKVDYSLALYQNDWKGALILTNIFNPVACYAPATPIALTAACPLTAGGLGFFSPNDARIRGVEFAISGRPSRNLSLDLTVDYKDAKWRNYANTGFNVFTGLVTAAGDSYRGDGNHLARIPALSGTLSGTYRGEINKNWGFYVRGDALYTGKAWDSDINIFKTNDFVRVNARLGVTRDNFTIEAFSTNLLNDKNYDVSALTVDLSPGLAATTFTQRAVAVVPAQRREFGLRGQFKF